MKPVFITALAMCAIVSFSCKKDKQEKSEYPFVYLGQCINKTFGTEKVNLCFDEIVSDSRCPVNAFCVWEGTAIAKFTFSKNGSAHQITLSTLPLNVPYAKDTTIDGYKIEFVDLKPYKVMGENYPSPKKLHAEVKITSP